MKLTPHLYLHCSCKAGFPLSHNYQDLVGMHSSGKVSVHVRVYICV